MIYEVICTECEGDGFLMGSENRLYCPFCNGTGITGYANTAGMNTRPVGENEEEGEEFNHCATCDLPDACSDFGCAILQGIRPPDDPFLFL